MVPLAGIFGIHNTGVSLAIELLIFFLFVVYLALVYWTYADARRRIADPMIVGCATAASLFPYVGTIVYMIIRPPEYLDDVRERELEIQAAEARLAELGYHLCPHCDAEVEKDFLRCPNCMRKLKDPCQSCGRPLDPRWKVCPYCEAEVGPAQSAPRRARRRRDGSPEQPVAAPPGLVERSGNVTRVERAGAPSVERGASVTERGGGAPVERGGAAPVERGGGGPPVDRGGAAPLTGGGAASSVERTGPPGFGDRPGAPAPTERTRPTGA